VFAGELLVNTDDAGNLTSISGEVSPGLTVDTSAQVSAQAGYSVVMSDIKDDFVKLGFGSKQKLIDWCAENSRVPAREYWDDPWVQTLIKPHAVAGVEPWATMFKAAPDAMITKYRAEDISIVVVGGETQGGFRMISGSFSRAKTVSVDDWR